MTVRPSARIPHRMSTTRGVFTALFAAGVAIFAAPGVAQAQMPPDIAAKVAALGRVVDPANTGKIYEPLQEKEPYAGVKVARDLKYGPNERNVARYLFLRHCLHRRRPSGPDVRPWRRLRPRHQACARQSLSMTTSWCWRRATA